MIAEVNYVGSSAKGLTSNVDVNPFDLSTLGGTPTRILNANQNQGFMDFCANNFDGPSDCPISNGCKRMNDPRSETGGAKARELSDEDSYLGVSFGAEQAGEDVWLWQHLEERVLAMVG